MNISPQKKSSRKKPAAGFSLVELLVVMVITAVLAALLLPIFKSALDDALSTKCASNMRAISVAFRQYIADTGKLPPYRKYNPVTVGTNTTMVGGDSWNDPSYLQPYFPSQSQAAINLLMTCPKATTPYYNKTTGKYYYHYGMTADTNEASAAIFTKPSRLFLLGEVSDGLGRISYATTNIAYRHNNNRVNMVFLDGHLESLQSNNVPTPAQKGTPAWIAFWGIAASNNGASDGN